MYFCVFCFFTSIAVCFVFFYVYCSCYICYVYCCVLQQCNAAFLVPIQHFYILTQLYRAACCVVCFGCMLLCFCKITLLFALQHCSMYCLTSYNSWSSGQTVLKWSNSLTYSRLWSLTHKPAMSPALYTAQWYFVWRFGAQAQQSHVQLAPQFSVKVCVKHNSAQGVRGVTGWVLIGVRSQPTKKGGAPMWPLLSM